MIVVLSSLQKSYVSNDVVWTSFALSTKHIMSIRSVTEASSDQKGSAEPAASASLTRFPFSNPPSSGSSRMHLGKNRPLTDTPLCASVFFICHRSSGVSSAPLGLVPPWITKWSASGTEPCSPRSCTTSSPARDHPVRLRNIASPERVPADICESTTDLNLLRYRCSCPFFVQTTNSTPSVEVKRIIEPDTFAVRIKRRRLGDHSLRLVNLPPAAMTAWA